MKNRREHDLVVVNRKVDTLIIEKGHPREHFKKQLKYLARSINKFGFIQPVVIDEALRVIAGAGRIAAAQALGYDEVPTIMVTGLSDAERRAYRIADNKIAEMGTFNVELLIQEFELISAQDRHFDLAETAYELPEIEALFNVQSVKQPDKLDKAPAADRTKPAITQLGDIWILGGRHRLICEDARKPESYTRLMCGEKAHMVFTDAPYNTKIKNNVSGLGAVKHDEFVMASGEMSPDGFRTFLRSSFQNLVSFSEDGSIHYLCMDWRHIEDMMIATCGVYSKFMNLCVWNKTNAGMSAFYRSKHELVFVFKSGTLPHVNNFKMGEFGRHRTNVWDYAGATVPTRERLDELALHPTVKPVQLVADAIKDCSLRGHIILDAFVGSGTTIVAAEITGRRAHALELDPYYADTTIRRWQQMTGEEVVQESDGLRFPQQVEA